MSSSGRKRKRPPTTTQVIGNGASLAQQLLPDIPGVPMDVIPSMVNAIRVTTKFYQKTTIPFSVLDHEDDDEQNIQKNDTAGIFPTAPRTSTNSIANGGGLSSSSSTAFGLDSVLNRVQVVKTKLEEKQRKNDQKERKQLLIQAVTRWLEHVKRFVIYNGHSAGNRNDNDNSELSSSSMDGIVLKDGFSSKPKGSVPQACFVYLWKLQHEHDRIAVRRAALYLAGMLLLKSCECRSFLFGEEEDDGENDNENESDEPNPNSKNKHTVLLLSSWIQSLINTNKISWKNPELAAKQIPLWQREAELLLSYLVADGYASSSLYPKVGVALLRLRQLCPHLLVFQQNNQNDKDDQDVTLSILSSSSMVEWREWRDVALKYGPEEIRRVQKWINLSHKYLEILVPRMGQEFEDKDVQQEQCKQHIDNTNSNKEEDEEEDNVDWEDGDDDQQENALEDAIQVEKNPYNSLEHLLAVERTLAAMESSGGIKGGEMVIDFRNPTEEDEEITMNGKNNQKNEDIQRKLRKCVHVLSHRHMPRLCKWVEGLTYADNLIPVLQHVSTESASSTLAKSFYSLVSLPSETAKVRKQLVDRLSEVKPRLASIFSSASKLNIYPTNATTPAEVAEMATASIAAKIIAPPPRVGRSGAVARGRPFLAVISSTRLQFPKHSHQSSRKNRKIQIKFRSR